MPAFPGVTGLDEPARPTRLVDMPIYEYACPKCRRIFSFLSPRVNPDRTPVCPKCGGKNLQREMSRFALLKGTPEPASTGDEPGDGMDGPDMDDPRVAQTMAEIERDMDHLDENNPRHLAHMLRKMKDLMPGESTSPEMESALKRLEAGEDPEKIEQDMGDVFGSLMGSEEEGPGGMGGGGGAYSRDDGLYGY